jgi:hypothetical protein
MRKLGKRGRSILKKIHVFCASIWLGSSLCLLFLLLTGLGNRELGEFLRTERLMYWVIVEPSAVGLLVTAILFSSMTNLGFFKIPGIIVAYTVTVFLMAGSALILIPHMNGMIDVAKHDPAGMLTNHVFVSDAKVAIVFLGTQFVLLTGGVFSPKG